MIVESTLLSYTSLCLLIITIIIVIFFFYDRETWDKYGVKHAKMGKEGLTDLPLAIRNMIREHGDTVGMKRGHFFLITQDLDLLRHILVKDFNNFVDRILALQSTSAITKGLFFQCGQDWKRLRQITSPSFSSGKIKSYFKPVDESALKLSRVLVELATRDQLLPIKHLAGQYTSEIIARLAFGLQTDCLGKEDDEFTHFSKTMFKIHGKFLSGVLGLLRGFPSFYAFLVKTLNLSILDRVSKESDKYFNSVLHKTLKERQEMASRGDAKFKDLLQSLVIAKEEGDRGVINSRKEVAEDDEFKDEDDNSPKSMTDEELIGQAMLIIFAGFETTSNTLHFCLYLLAKHPEIQEKVYQEIMAVVKSDTPTYEELAELKYTTQVIDETLRLHPPLSVITRKALATSTYKSITIPKDAVILIPLDAVMLNDKYYPEPNKFNPDRFTEENKAKRDPMTFVPFGCGPRICVGMRLAYLELKLGLVHVLRKVRIELNENTEPKEGGDITTRFQGFIVVEPPIQLAVRLRDKVA